MSHSRHGEDAAKRYEDAAWRVELASQKPDSPETTREWLSALSDLVAALAEIERSDHESVVEKLDMLGRFVGLERFAAAGHRRRAGRGAQGRRAPH